LATESEAARELIAQETPSGVDLDRLLADSNGIARACGPRESRPCLPVVLTPPVNTGFGVRKQHLIALNPSDAAITLAIPVDNLRLQSSNESRAASC